MEMIMAETAKKRIRLYDRTTDQPVAITPRAESDCPAYEMLPDRYDDPFRRSGGPDVGEPD
jgi:hypothetical protein